MKTLRVAVVVAVVLTFICIQESSAVPVTEVQELEDTSSHENPIAEHAETSVESWMMPYNSRQKRSRKCKICCGCCTPGVCGLCCKF
ncbi:hepcidin-like [Notolabrus celidotus]|uniref:hepcidin-like n=1 Tax=Notolabrus celidotus TaxID=1203425 RepID=UPI001490685F|nr:hepcidin-like [Notolabrus celidotus]